MGECVCILNIIGVFIKYASSAEGLHFSALVTFEGNVSELPLSES